VIVVDTLTSNSAIVGGATFGSAGNQIATLGAMTVSSGNLVLVDGIGLSVAGPLSAPNAAITTPAAIALPGAISTGTLSLSAGGTIVRPVSAGTLRVGTLTGSAVQLADFGQNANVSTLGQFVVTGSTLALGNAQALSITGPLSAEYIAITAIDLLTLTGSVTTTGLNTSTQVGSTTAVNPGSYFAVSQGAGGTPTIHQIGSLFVQPPQGAQTATVRLDLPTNGGTILLDNLVGPQMSLILYLRTGGQASGTINVGQLTVIGTNGSSALNGFVANQTGPEAARLAAIKPDPSTTYRVNSCPIGSVNCVLIPLGTFLNTNPLRDYALDTGTSNNDDELALPDVSSTDY
jgi:hypothetical protein